MIVSPVCCDDAARHQLTSRDMIDDYDLRRDLRAGFAGDISSTILRIFAFNSQFVFISCDDANMRRNFARARFGSTLCALQYWTNCERVTFFDVVVMSCTFR